MKRPPIDPKQTIFADSMAGQPLLWFILWVGLLIGAVTIGIQAWAMQNKLAHWQTMTFTVLCFSQLGNAVAIRSRRESVFSMDLFANKPMLGAIGLTIGLQLMLIYTPFFNGVFSTQPLTWAELGITVGVSSLVFWAVEIQKLVLRQRSKKHDE
jgi:P-type Ca2+ transporter type 2C